MAESLQQLSLPSEEHSVHDYPSDLIVGRVEFMQYDGSPSINAISRGRVWNYMTKRFEIDRRNIGHVVAAKFGGTPPEPTGLEFDIYPEYTDHSWPADEIDGLVVSTLKVFVDTVNDDLDAKDTDADRSRVLRARLGHNVGISVLRHMDSSAAHFLRRNGL